MYMAYSTYWNNIELMFGCIIWKMIFLCIFVAFDTFKSFGMRQFACFNRIAHSRDSCGFFWITNTIHSRRQTLCPFPFFCLSVFLSYCFSLYALPIISLISLAFFTLSVISCPKSLAFFTVRLSTNFSSFALTKLRKLLNFFAFGTSFGYDWFRHSFLLIRRLCLGLHAESISVCSSFYINNTSNSCQGEKNDS